MTQPAIPAFRFHLPSRLIGRAAALQALVDATARAIAGEPCVVLVSGEAGVGKTRLLREAAALAEARGAQVCMTRCIEGSLVPYLPFATALLPRLERAGLLEDAEGLRGLRSGLAAPEILSTEGRTPEVFFELPAATFELASRRPLLLVIDDIHWADSGTLPMLEHLVLAAADEGAQREIPLCIIAGHRNVAANSPAGKVLGHLRREQIVQSVTLAGLDELEMNDLLWDALGGPCAPPLLTAIHRATAGNPLFALELLKLLSAEGKLVKSGGYVSSEADPAELPLQNEVTAALEERAALLPAACADLLTFAALTGDEVTYEVAQAVSGLPAETVIALAEAGIEAGFVTDVENGIRFAHPLVRHVFSRRWSAARRRQAHLSIVEAIEERASDDGAREIEVAEHLLAAGPAADPLRRGHAACRGGEIAFSLAAWGEAARYYSAAVANSAYFESIPGIERARLAYRAATARYRNLDVPGSREGFAQAIALFREEGDFLGWADALVAWARAHISHDLYGGPRVLESPEVREFFAAVGDKHPTARARMETQIAEVLFTAQRPEAREYAERALAVGRETGDVMLTMHASDTLAITNWLTLNPAEALAHHEEALVLAREIGDPWYEAWPLQRMPLALAALGRLKEAESITQQASVLAERTHDWAEHSLTLASMAALATLRGDLDVAQQCAAGSAMMYRRSNYAWSPGIAYPALIQSRLARGEWEAAAHATALWRETGAGSAAWFASLLCRAHEGSIDPLLTEMENNPGRVSRLHPTDMLSLGTLSMRAEVASLSGELQVATQAKEVLGAAVERGILFSVGLGAYLLPRVLADLASASGEHAEAERRYGDALVAARMSRARHELARAAFGYTALLIRKGDSADQDRAERLLQEAATLFADMGMAPWTRKANELAARAGIDLEAAGAPSTARGPDREDLDIIKQVADGATRREIAARLLLSERAVSKRLAAIRVRLGIDGEEDARAYLRQLRARPAPPPPRQAAEPPGGVRILVVSDIVGSTQLNERMGDQHWVELLEQHNAIVREQFARFAGTEVKHTGDGIFGWFPTASAALDCALAIAEHFPVHHAESGGRADVCIGMSAGEPVVAAGDLFGLAVTQAFRICDRAGPGEVLVSDSVRHLVEGATFQFEDRGRLALKGFRERTRVHRVMAHQEHEPAVV